MLPDYTKAKEIFRDHLFELFAKRIKAINPLSIVPSKTIVEGDGATIVRENGESAPFDFQGLSSSITHTYKDIPYKTVSDIYREFIRMADEFAEQQFILTIKQVDKAAEKVGNTASGGLTAESFFELTRKRLIPFDENGQMKNQMLVINPANVEYIKDLLNKIDTDPELKKEYNEIIEIKKREWHDRENSRRLVD